MTTFKNLLVEIEEFIALITINRPEKLNALNRQTLEELQQFFDQVEEDEQVKGILITGAGGKAFVAGADLQEIQQLNAEAAIAFARFGQRLFSRIEQFPKPVVALVNGYALGGGCELAMSCHFRLVSETAKFGQPEINLGIIPGYGGTQRLPRLVGKGRALEIMLTGDMIDAQEALRIGLVNRVLPSDELIAAGRKILKKIAAKGAVAVRAILETVNLGLEQPLEQAMETEALQFGRVCNTEDKTEGIQAFFEKRPPQFKGR
ncbi:MAG: enoyl-CoA hydratase/isomerase family protein [Caldisericaceae bacterium]|nr:enoyl-CoA hydratase/isomerase family protein [Caldisericaceae bacterium]